MSATRESTRRLTPGALTSIYDTSSSIDGDSAVNIVREVARISGGPVYLFFARRVQSLPPQTQRLLLVAAAEPVGDVTLLWRAAERLGIAADAAASAQAAGLLEVGARVLFRRPLVRSAAYRTADPTDRQEIHRALAEATDPDTDPDRRAWHRAHAAAGPDEAVAADLELSADRARSRGGVAAAATFLERTTELTPDPARRAARALAAAQATFEAGAPDAASELLTVARIGPLDELQRARLAWLRAQIVFTHDRGTDAPPLLLDAAQQLEPLDPGLAREAYLEALGAAIFTSRLSGRCGLREVAEAARAAPAGPQPPRLIDLLLDGVAVRFTEGYVASVPPLQRALLAFRDQAGHRPDDRHARSPSRRPGVPRRRARARGRVCRRLGSG